MLSGACLMNKALKPGDLVHFAGETELYLSQETVLGAIAFGVRSIELLPCAYGYDTDPTLVIGVVMVRGRVEAYQVLFGEHMRFIKASAKFKRILP